ncbi:SpoIID/LytB domain-containing protein [uncultured Dysosmobacter sp.]|uniref:SpoIID/LytB domain-containing protein n=1 Tax=uncultured Dysosmobacter sp. TaxID=2591384 RepID=UPI00260AEEA7|nr:SpoIID/LytB domain-containing protein [uncultured Dysosmobacter sp.]
MKKILWTAFIVVTFFALTAVSASAEELETVRVGLRYGSTALFSANLENAEGSGYEFGYYEDGDFTSLGWTDERTISMTAAGDIYMSTSGTYSAAPPSGGFRHMGAWHVELDGFRDFEEAQEAAWEQGGYPAWIDWEYVVRVGCYDSRSEAEDAAADLDGYAVQSSSTGVMVTVTKTTDVIFEFDCSGILDLGVLPDGQGGEPVTWFKGYRYAGGFSYPRVTGGNLSVVNMVSLEDYVKGVIPSEMSGSWPLEALKAQAVCARTYACRTSKHTAYNIDVCATSDCQVYNGRSQASTASDQAVDETAGEKLYYDGYLVQDPVYHSSNGGATEDCVNVWGTAKGYLQGKEDPYEARISIPNYTWSVTYSASELSWILQQKGYDVGTVKNVYVSEYTPMGNVKKVIFEGTGGTKTVTGDTCRTIFYSSTYNKSVKSLRFSINGGGPVSGGSVYVNSSGDSLSSLDGVAVISGGGKITSLDGGAVSVISSSGTSTVSAGGSTARPSSAGTDSFTITGTGSGHNVGMSQYGAKAMAEACYDYLEILEFYYTDIEIY